MQAVRMDRAPRRRHGRSQRLPVREEERIRPRESQRLRLRHGRRAHRDGDVRHRRHPVALFRRRALPGAVRVKILTSWLREFVDLKIDDQTLARDLTMAGIAVEGMEKAGNDTVFTMEITTNRPDAMNHYGVAREAAAIYDKPLKPIVAKLPKAKGEAKFHIQIDDAQGCAPYPAPFTRGEKIGASPKKAAARPQANDPRSITPA